MDIHKSISPKNSYNKNETEEQQIAIKEGFMVKKGHVRHNWKSRWFILYADYLNYYKIKGDTTPKGVIKLKGCSIISPDPEYTKKECVFRLIEIYGREYLLQCSNEIERDEWVKILGSTIRALDTRLSKNNSIKESNRPTLHSPAPVLLEAKKSPDSPLLVILQNRVTHEELLMAMQDIEAGVSLNTHFDGDNAYKMCFTGQQLVNWLMNWSFVQTREEGRILAGELLEKVYLHPVGATSDSSFKRVAARKVFGDNKDSLYRFSSLNLNIGLDIEFDLSDDSSEEDGDEENILESFKATIVKQGFLVKKRNGRNTWKVRKFILYDDPARLIYRNPTKEQIKNEGRIRLFGSEVKILKNDDDRADISSSRDSKNVVREHCFMITTRKGHKYILQAPTDVERNQWMHLLEDILKKYDCF